MNRATEIISKVFVVNRLLRAARSALPPPHSISQEVLSVRQNPFGRYRAEARLNRKHLP